MYESGVVTCGSSTHMKCTVRLATFIFVLSYILKNVRSVIDDGVAHSDVGIPLRWALFEPRDHDGVFPQGVNGTDDRLRGPLKAQSYRRSDR